MKRMLLMCPLMLFSVNALALTNVREVFEYSVMEYVDRILGGGNDIYIFSLSVLCFLGFLLALQEVGHYIFEGLDIERLMQAGIMFFITLGLWAFYSTAFDVVWRAADELSLLFLEIGTGNRDPMYLSKWIGSQFSKVVMSGESLWRAPIETAILSGAWFLISMILQALMYFVGIWAVWGMALAKILGILFIPFLMLPQTRSFFDGWMRFVVGFIVLMIVLRITGVIAALTLQSQFDSIGLACGDVGNICGASSAVAMAFNDFDPSDFIIMAVVSICIVASSFGFASTLSAGVGASSDGITRSATKLATKLAATLL